MAVYSVSGANSPSTVFVTTNYNTYKAVKAIFDTVASSAYYQSSSAVVGTFVAAGTEFDTYTGAGDSVTGIFAGQHEGYAVGTALNSTIYGGDGTNTRILDNSPVASVTAFYGQGSNIGTFEGTASTVSTDAGGSNTLGFSLLRTAIGEQQTNIVDSSGQDTISITGTLRGDQSQTNLISVSGAGIDSVTLGNATALTFINNGSGVSTVSPGNSDSVSVSGTGSTSVNAASGNTDNMFFVDTAAGNVTLTGSQPDNSIEFDHPASGAVDTGTAQEVVNGYFGADPSIVLAGYGTSSVPSGGQPAAYTAASANGATTLTLSDNTTIQFVGISSVNDLNITLKS